ncbi:hypothetical protein SNEBB_001816 [Seison nebaliae]|nr:hypothetical protein SNEBB_001816 [Seison nebaliae]
MDNISKKENDNPINKKSSNLINDIGFDKMPRNKTLRQQLPASTCEQCFHFWATYNLTDAQLLEKLRVGGCRHRSNNLKWQETIPRK